MRACKLAAGRFEFGFVEARVSQQHALHAGLAMTERRQRLQGQSVAAGKLRQLDIIHPCCKGGRQACGKVHAAGFRLNFQKSSQMRTGRRDQRLLAGGVDTAHAPDVGGKTA
jgi:hypothetical protein